MRIVSLLPSATEIVYALGLDDQLVGVTFECDEPADARQTKAVVVGGRDTRDMTPAQIDRYVRSQMAAGTDLYTLHADAMAGLDPDLIITQDLCRVCAIPSGEVSAALDHLGCRADVLSLDPYSLDDVLDSVLAVAARADVAAAGDVLVGELRARLDAVRNAVAGRPRPRAAVIEWVDPPFSAGHWIPDLIEAAGGQPVAARPRQRSIETTWEQIGTADPEVVLVAPCGFHLDGAVRQAQQVLEHLPGVTENNIAVWAIDGDSLLVRPGPRLVDGAEAIAAILHPGSVPPPPAGQVQQIR